MMPNRWESPNMPTGELEEVFVLAEKFRAITEAPAVSMTHFLLAYVLISQPYKAKDILKLFKQVQHDWENELKGKSDVQS